MGMGMGDGVGWGGVWVWCGGGTLVHFLVWALAIGRCIGFGQVGRGAGFWVLGSGRAMGRGVTMCRGEGGKRLLLLLLVVVVMVLLVVWCWRC